MVVIIVKALKSYGGSAIAVLEIICIWFDSFKYFPSDLSNNILHILFLWYVNTDTKKAIMVNNSDNCDGVWEFKLHAIFSKEFLAILDDLLA